MPQVDHSPGEILPESSSTSREIRDTRLQSVEWPVSQQTVKIQS